MKNKLMSLVSAGILGLSGLNNVTYADASLQSPLKHEREIVIKGDGEVSLKDSSWIKDNNWFVGVEELFDNNDDGIIDIYSLTAPRGKVLLNLHYDGKNSENISGEEGIKNYFSNFKTFACDWNKQSIDYGVCEEITKPILEAKTNLDILMSDQKRFSIETEPYFVGKNAWQIPPEDLR